MENYIFLYTRWCWQVLSPTRKETSYSDQTRDLFNILATKLTALLSPLLYLCKPLKKIQKFVRPTRSPRQHRWHRWRFWSAFRHFGTHFTESFRMSKSSWMMDPTRSREMPSCSDIDLAEIRRSFKISSWIWSIISGVVTVLGRPGRGASQDRKSVV
jgi:hypothetical protein